MKKILGILGLLLCSNFIFSQHNLQPIPSIKYVDHKPVSDSLYFSSFYTNTLPGQKEGKQFDIKWLAEGNKVLFATQFEKLELGLKFTTPQYNKLLENFFKGNNGRQEINPYDRKDINIETDFYKVDPILQQWKGPFHKEAFYYQDFKRRIDNEVVRISGWDKVPTDYPFRIRFTPREQGLWVCIYTISINGKEKGKAFFKFWVVANEDQHAKDFLFVDSNNNYLATHNNRGQKEGFFGFGHNLGAPSCFDCEDFPCAGLEAYCGEETWDLPIYPQVYKRYLRELDEAAAHDINYFRMLMMPTSYEFEFEKLNDYTDRLNCAWELDQVLEKIKENDMRMHLNMQVHFVLDMPNLYGATHWDWSAYKDQRGCNDPRDKGYCYNHALGLDESIYFFTDERAKYHYKNRLRYMVSRYGYSPNIAALELFSEINGFGQKPVLKLENRNGNLGCYAQGYDWGDKYYKRDSVPKILDQWQREMLGYIKNELGHKDHITTVSYTGIPYTDSTAENYGGCNVVKGDSIYYSDWIDIWTFNYYANDVLKPRHAISFATQYDSQWDKPLMFSEIGHSDNFMTCDSMISFIDVLVTSPFTGIANMGLNWSYAHNTNGHWRYYKYMKRFIDQLDFSRQDYKPKVQLNKDETVMMVYLDAQGKKSEKAGAITNLTVNYFTKATGLPCADTNNLYPNKKIYKKLQKITSKNEFSFKKMGAFHPYKVEYYYPLTGKTIKKQSVKSNLFGKLKLDIPDLDTNIKHSRILFRITSSKDSSDKIHKEKNIPIYAEKDYGEIVPVEKNRNDQLIFKSLVINKKEFLDRAPAHYYFVLYGNKVIHSTSNKEDIKQYLLFNSILEVDENGAYTLCTFSE